MVAIKDFVMPSRCMNCGLLGKEKMYCSIYPRRDLDVITVATNRPDWCPLVEIEECKVGTWKSDGHGHIVCTACNEVNVTIWKSKYCPCCGAEMRGSEKE